MFHAFDIVFRYVVLPLGCAMAFGILVVEVRRLLAEMRDA